MIQHTIRIGAVGMASGLCLLFVIEAARADWSLAMSDAGPDGGLGAAQLSAGSAAEAADARAALMKEPLDAEALRRLGLTMANDNPGRGAQLWELGERVTRRDLPTQLLLLQNAALHDDLPATLTHYDRALTVHPEAGDKLFPVLARGLADPAIAAGLAPYAQRRWFPLFLAAALPQGAEPQALVRLYASTRARFDAENGKRVRASLLARLIATKQFSLARDIARATPGIPLGTLDRLAFTPATTAPQLGPMGWNLIADETGGAELNEKGQLDVTVPLGRNLLAAQRIMLVQPGTHMLRQTVAYADDVPRARLTWSVQCLNDPSVPTVWQQVVPTSGRRTTYRSRFTIPAACTAQLWRLAATADLAQQPSDVRLEAAGLE